VESASQKSFLFRKANILLDLCLPACYNIKKDITKETEDFSNEDFEKAIRQKQDMVCRGVDYRILRTFVRR
jgi:hypothetical protein